MYRQYNGEPREIAGFGLSLKQQVPTVIEPASRQPVGLIVATSKKDHIVYQETP